MAREELVEIFEDTLNLCRTEIKLAESIENCEQVVVTDQNAMQYLKDYSGQSERRAKVIVSKKRTFEAASAYKGKHICVLNFASATRPGGGVENGARAQEECLCRTSTLYPCITKPEVMNNFHKKHRMDLKSGAMTPLYNNDCILTRDVVVFKSDVYKPEFLPETQWFTTDVISCAAPNLRRMFTEDTTVDDEMLFRIHKERLNRVMDLAKYAKADVVILGAFGCGAFANPPEVVAKAMHDAIQEHIHDFETIELAVYCSPGDSRNYEVFSKKCGE